MTSSETDLFAETVQKSDIWIKETMEELGVESRRMSYDALRAVLHAVRDQIPTDVVAHLASELPMLIRGIYYEGWDPHALSQKDRSRRAFLDQIAREIPYSSQVDLVYVTRGVLSVVKRHVSPGQYDQARRTLPAELRELWPAQEHERRAA